MWHHTDRPRHLPSLPTAAQGSGSGRVSSQPAPPGSPRDRRIPSAHRASMPQISAVVAGGGSSVVSASRIAQLENRVETAEKGNRALLEELVRLQGEVKALTRRSERSAQDHAQDVEQLRGDVRSNHGGLDKLRAAVLQVQDKFQAESQEQAQAASARRQMASQLGATQQELRLLKVDMESSSGAVQRDFDELRQLCHRSQSDLGQQVRVASEGVRQIKYTQEDFQSKISENLASFGLRVSNAETETRATVEALMKLQHEVKKSSDSVAAMFTDLSQRVRRLESPAGATHVDPTATAQVERRLAEMEQQVSRASAETNPAAGKELASETSKVLEQVQELRRLQETAHHTTSEQLADSVETQTKRLLEVESRFRQELDAVRLAYQVAFKDEEGYRREFELEVRSSADQRFKTLQATMAEETGRLHNALTSAQLEAVKSLAKFDEGMALLERSMEAQHKGVLQVVQAEIQSRKRETQQLREQLATHSRSTAAAKASEPSSNADESAAMIMSLDSSERDLRDYVRKEMEEHRESTRRCLDDMDVRFERLIQQWGRLDTAHAARMETTKKEIAEAIDASDAALTELHERSAAQYKELEEKIQEVPIMVQDVQETVNRVQLELLSRLDKENKLRSQEISSIKLATSRKVEEDSFIRQLEDLKSQLSKSNLQNAGVTSKFGQLEADVKRVHQSLASLAQNEAAAREMEAHTIRRELDGVQHRVQILIQQHDELLLGNRPSAPQPVRQHSWQDERWRDGGKVTSAAAFGAAAEVPPVATHALELRHDDSDCESGDETGCDNDGSTIDEEGTTDDEGTISDGAGGIEDGDVRFYRADDDQVVTVRFPGDSSASRSEASSASQGPVVRDSADADADDQMYDSIADKLEWPAAMADPQWTPVSDRPVEVAGNDDSRSTGTNSNEDAAGDGSDGGDLGNDSDHGGGDGQCGRLSVESQAEGRTDDEEPTLASAGGPGCDSSHGVDGNVLAGTGKQLASDGATVAPGDTCEDNSAWQGGHTQTSPHHRPLPARSPQPRPSASQHGNDHDSPETGPFSPSAAQGNDADASRPA